MRKITLLLSCFVMVTFSVSAQNTRNSIAKLKKETSAFVSLTEDSGIPEFIKFPIHERLSLNGLSLKDKTTNFLNRYKDAFALKSVSNEFVFSDIITDNHGFQHVDLKQEYHGVPVYDGILKFHFDASSKLAAINGNYIPYIKLNPAPTITENQARAIAVNEINKQPIHGSGKPVFVNKSTLYVFPVGKVQGYITSIKLVYEVEVRNDLDVREFIFIDAHDGSIAEQFTGMAHALDRRLYENNTGNLIWQEGDALPGSLDQWQQNEVIASEHMYNFFNNAFGYVSYDGADAQMRTVNNDPGISCPNANWNGATANYCTGTASDDVVCHEWGHAYTEYTSGLIYAWQSGAMNESYSDIWGETIDLLNNYEDADDDQSLRTACNSSDRWRMGEDASAFGGAIRDMWRPSCNGDPNYVSHGNYWCTTGDSGGVHINSGIPNRAYAFLVDGGSANGHTVTGIGFTKAAHIFWRAQSVYLTPTSDFADLGNALTASGTDLLGINLEGLSTTSTAAGPSGEIISAADLVELNDALLAVELIDDPTACGFVALLNETVSLCGNATAGPIYREDWESGIGSWIVTQLPTNPATWDPREWIIDSALPSGRAGSGIYGPDPIIGNCSSDLDNGIIRLESPTITMPNDASGTYELVFDHYVSTETDWDGGNIKYSLNGGGWTLIPGTSFTTNAYNGTLMTAGAGNDNPLRGQEAFHGADGGSLSGSWGQSVVDLSTLGVTANSDIQFRWELGTDGCNGSIGWYLDEVVVFNCSVLGVQDSEVIENNVSVYPNPSNGIFTLEKTQSIDLDYAKIFDINGRLVQTIDLSTMSTTLEIDLSSIASGVYFMKVSSDQATNTIKLSKQ